MQEAVMREGCAVKLGLYIHIPFCRSKCSYCAFVSAAPRDDQEMDRYVNAVMTHIRASSNMARNRELSTIFFGGGTPSLIGGKRLALLLECIFETFSIADNVEITLEANPESATAELFQHLTPLGLNRVSLGVQSMHDEELKQLGRIHSVATVERAASAIREAGIPNVSMDLIFALPGQTVRRWEDTLQKILRLTPDHLSVYGLSFEEGTLFHRLNQKGRLEPVLDETYVRMYNRTRDLLTTYGFWHYEISNWSRPDRECRHNLIYWNQDEYLAFGAAAHGLFDGIRHAFISEKETYVRFHEQHQKQRDRLYFNPELLAEYKRLDVEEMASDVMIYGLRLIKGVSIDRFINRFGYSPRDRWQEAIDKFERQNLLEQKEEYLRLTPQALLISNEVLQYFLD